MDPNGKNMFEVYRAELACIRRALEGDELGTAAGMMFSMAKMLFATGLMLKPDEHDALHKRIDAVLAPYLEKETHGDGPGMRFV